MKRMFNIILIDSLPLDWSILYVFVGVIASCLLLAGVFWGMACACRQSKKPHKRQKVQKYALIGTQDEEAANCKFELCSLPESVSN